MGVDPSPLTAAPSWIDDRCILVIDGVLDGTTYLPLRDAIIKAALQEPRAVVIEVDALTVPQVSAWAVFTSARWHVSVWPDVPIVLTCADAEKQATIRRSGITRYVPVVATVRGVDEVLPEVHDRYRRRARAELPGDTASVAAARFLIRDWLTAWLRPQFIAAATTAATVLIQNAIDHTQGAVTLRVETNGSWVTVAVHDSSVAAPTRAESAAARRGVSGLDFLTAVSSAWGHNPFGTGKVVWAVIGPDDCL